MSRDTDHAGNQPPVESQWLGKPLSRRTVLRGLGVTMALPWLEAMASGSHALAGVASAASGTASAGLAAGGHPLRTAFIFAPNGVNYEHWLPTQGAGREFTLSPTLEAIAPVRDRVNVLTGLTLDKARANGDGPGDHARSAASFLTGQQARKTAGNDIQIGVSIDQFVAQQVGSKTSLPSLEMGCEHGRAAGSCDSGYACAYSSNVSWRDEDTPVAMQTDPRAVFERLFGDSDSKKARAERLRRRRSVLDYVLEDSRRLENGLGVSDRHKLDEFQTAVREIERRVSHAQESSPPLPDHDRPDGVPREIGAHIDLMYDMMLLAFRMDMTRLSTFMLGTAGSNRAYPELGIKEGHHNLSHHRGDADMIDKIRRIDRFRVERFAKFISDLQATPEGNGSLLDNCTILYGSGISDGNRHDHHDLPILLAGNGGGRIDTGRLVRYKRDTPLCNLYVSLAEQMGCQVESFGDSTGPLEGLKHA